MIKFFKLFSPSLLVRRSANVLNCFKGRFRSFADTTVTTSTDVDSKQIAQGPENEQKLRVRRARPSDVPRVLRFVRENARVAWPSIITPAPPTASNLVLCDYVARALAQGHTMVAEQHSSRRGWLQIRGLALSTAVCAWDAALVERWARCLRCPRSRRVLNFTAHCLRAPALHDKYRVHNILQVNLIVPSNVVNNKEIVHVLAKSAIQRGRDIGFPLLRFDVTDEDIANSLEELQMKKEWQLAYDILPEAMHEKDVTPSTDTNSVQDKDKKTKFFAVYTTFTQTDKTPTLETTPPPPSLAVYSEPPPNWPSSPTA
ncbi:uncharacterized protein LOC113235300 isoform X2 [Hyposmocoma kahamanoa]|uniref:uncharacterized protein LOC113235300 isoform X2 n=1 Tax=Hyposmocoma kahamanoa TaxID=1477025 RepID=UPI000E6D9F8A|nr:uncharacterized protein LOC113235300 isoform X2 [Hyposmocoma kahamanoa]